MRFLSILFREAFDLSNGIRIRDQIERVISVVQSETT